MFRGKTNLFYISQLAKHPLHSLFFKDNTSNNGTCQNLFPGLSGPTNKQTNDTKPKECFQNSSIKELQLRTTVQMMSTAPLAPGRNRSHLYKNHYSILVVFQVPLTIFSRILGLVMCFQRRSALYKNSSCR